MIESIKLTNKTTLQTVTIDRDESDWVLNEVNLGTVNGTHNSYKFLNQIGSYINSTSLEERPISISGWVIGKGQAALEENKRVLNRLINPLHSIDLLTEDSYKLTFKPDYSIKYAVPYRENNEVLCKFLIQGTCADPMFTLTNPEIILLAYTVPKFHFPLVIPAGSGVTLGERELVQLKDIVNPGDIDVGFTMELKATGSVVNPSILNIDTREVIKLNKTLTAGETVVISTVSGEKYLQGELDGTKQNYLQYLDFDSTWLQLHVGVNTIALDADSGVENLQAQISFQIKLLEVQ